MKKRKTDLFRFVTLRTPELISSDKKALGFIQHPNPSLSEFLDEIQLTLEATRLEFETIAGTFTASAIPTLEALKTQVGLPLWDFSMWLSKNKNKLVRSELDALMPTLAASVDADVITMWDNAFYDILRENNPYVRQGCLLVIVAKNFIDNYVSYSPGITTNEDEIAAEVLALKRLANGKVLVHEAFGLEKIASVASSLEYNLSSRKSFELKHTAKISQCKIAALIAVKEDLSDLEIEYKADFKAQYDIDSAANKISARVILDAYELANPELDFLVEDSYPDNLLTPFKFSYNDPLSLAYTADKVAGTTDVYLNANRLRNNSFSSAFEFVNMEIAALKKRASHPMNSKFSAVSINGVSFKQSSSKPIDFAYSLEEDEDIPGEYKVMLSIDTGYKGAYIASHTIKLTIGATTYTSNCPEVQCSKDNVLFVQLFSGSTIKMGDCETIVFEATIELDNGKKIKLYKKGNTKLTLYSGIAFVIKSDIENVVHYGVNKVGVADYRRVEQELCCYIPGEVSHIENILAKEYKEKSTRNLTRSEVSIETTTDREIEELTDTTSTSRHEMSTEISEVLQKDRSQNFGFDAGTSGEMLSKLEFNASAYGDFSFGQSSTDSNSSARTYAEDVTRRALERIVQKTTVTRSSKVLKEFEENSKHGFDNREGTEHVTGVYRWIDKVYKNRIINYGKRLMYEFMIPEPSKFYKEAIIIEVEEDSVVNSSSDLPASSGIALMPKHPSENSINSPADIQRDNYEGFAALYGASVSAPMEATRTESGSYGNSPGNGDSPKSYDHGPMMVPPNYICTTVKGNVNLSYKAHAGMAHMNFGVGGSNSYLGTYEGQGNDSQPINHTNQNIQGSVTINVTTKKITQYTASVQLLCSLQPSIFEEWQADVYQSIMQAYESKMAAYQDTQAIQALAAEAEVGVSEEERTLAGNPRFNAGIVNTELKRLCIEMLAKPFGIQQGKDFYRYGDCEIPELELTPSLDVYASYVKFFEQAFDWDLLSQKFYPYYWAKRCDWKELFQTQDGLDYIFQQFLQSGMGRVIVPVKQGFEDSVAFFMETGKIWSGIALVIDKDDDLNVSIVDEVMNIEGTVEGEEWETIIPSSLTIVQASSVLLDEAGLPCCDPDLVAELSLGTSTNTLTGQTPSV